MFSVNFKHIEPANQSVVRLELYEENNINGNLEIGKIQPTGPAKGHTTLSLSTSLSLTNTSPYNMYYTPYTTLFILLLSVMWIRFWPNSGSRALYLER